MALDAWLPIGFKLPDGAKVRTALFEGVDWQIYETMGGGRALVVLGALALILLTDQFPRNMFRATPRAFATDALAMRIAERAIARAFDHAYHPPLRRFFYLPFMHAEDIAAQKRCEALCAAAGDEEGVKYAVVHREIIEQFGRFPHRNPILGREMTEEEQRFLDGGGFSG